MPRISSTMLATATCVFASARAMARMARNTEVGGMPVPADMARTLDHLSDGRAVLGIGSGWMDKDEVEYDYPVRTPG